MTTFTRDDVRFVVIQWRCRWYTHTPLPELRDYLVPRILEAGDALIIRWVAEAEQWSRTIPKSDLQCMLDEYFELSPVI